MSAVITKDYSRQKSILGSNIRKSRERLGISGTELAGRIDSDKSAISKIENGERSPNFETLLKIADALETPIDILVHIDAPISSLIWMQGLEQKLSLLPPEAQKTVETAMTAMVEGLLISQKALSKKA